jgi:serine/threonine protein kinase
MCEPKSDDNPVDELAEEFARRWRAGERPDVEEYAKKYPQWADEIRALLPAVALMEENKPRREEATTAGALAALPGPPPERVGEYRIVREIGRGGMGVVYEAEQESLGRRVALKVLPGHLLTDAKLRARFRRESQAAARLHHTNIVPVFAVGERDGLCFYAMQLIRGRGLDQVVREALPARGALPPPPPTPADTADRTWPGGRPSAGEPERRPALAGLPPREFCRAIARIGVQVADALGYAHTQGILHRDIKPSNLLLDDRGAVWVTDFGVAKLVQEANLTQSGDLVGTLKYMPPERFAGQSDGRGDVYSLGVTLYELLTLHSAFPDTTPHHLIHLITHEVPTRLRKVNPDVPADLETIVLKAAARDPAQRYQTPEELAEDLRRFLYDRPILAKRSGPARRLWRWCRRNPALAGATAAAFLLMVAVTVVSAVGYARTAAAMDAEKAQREQAENTATLALEALNRTYERFAPTRLVATPQAANAEGIELPPQPALPPEAVPLLEDLLRTYEQIARSAGAFPRLHGQAAEANHRIGDLRQRLGRFEDAAAAYRTAIDLYTALPPEAAGGAVRIQLARACNDLGRTLRWQQKVEEAALMTVQAIETLAEAPPALAQRPEWRYELARSLFMLGQWSLPNPPHILGPERHPRRTLTQVREVMEHWPHILGPERHPRRGVGPARLAGPEVPLGSPDLPPPPSGGHPAERAAEILDQLVADFPSVPEYRHLLACCLRDLPPGGPGGGPEGWHENLNRAVALLEKLVKDFPQVPDYRLDLCETLSRPSPPGPLALPDPHKPDARQRSTKAVELAEELTRQYPNVPEYTAALARALNTFGTFLRRVGDAQEAEKKHRKAIELQGKLVGQYPEVAVYRCWLSLMERSLGRTLGQQRGRLKEARAVLESAAGRLEALARKDPRLGIVRPLLGTVYQDLAGVLNGSGETTLAAEVWRKAEECKPRGGHGPFGPHDGPPRPPPGGP